MIPRLPVADFFAVPPPDQFGPVAYAPSPVRHVVSRAAFVALGCGQKFPLDAVVAAADEAACRRAFVPVGQLVLGIAVDERSVA